MGDDPNYRLRSEIRQLLSIAAVALGPETDKAIDEAISEGFSQPLYIVSRVTELLEEGPSR